MSANRFTAPNRRTKARPDLADQMDCACVDMDHSCRSSDLRIVEKEHEAEVHVQLLVTVKQRHSGIVGHEVELDLLEAAEHHYILDHARRRLAADTHQLKTVPMQMQRMDIVAGIAEFQAIAPPFVDDIGGLHGLHRKGLSVQRPLVEAVQRAVVLYEGEFHLLVRLC